MMLVKLTGVALGLAFFALASLGFASRLWSWVLDFEPGFYFDQPPAPTGSALSSGVTILLIDGLRLDASRRMPALNALRGRGADIEGRVGTPSFSRPGRATIASGAPPDIHGVTTNRQKRALGLDNLFRRVGVLGGTCRVAGSKIWSSLFGDDIARCGVYREGGGKDGPGMFTSQVAEIRTSQMDGLAFILQGPATLRVADIISTDFAAHEHGGASSEYQAEVLRADTALADLITGLDLSRETLVVTSDHGHRDVGGHGGQEPEVLAVPIVMVGAGIRPLSTATADQADIAPTVAALLGAGLPAGSSGRPIDSVLLGDAAKLALVKSAAAAQAEGFAGAVAKRLGAYVERERSQDWRSLVHHHRDEEMTRRTPVAILLGLLFLSGVVALIHSVRPGARTLTIGVAVSMLALAAPLRSFIPPMSFSAINYDEMLIPFFMRVIALAFATALLAIVGALLARRFVGQGARVARPSAVAGATGLVGSAALAGATLASWLHHGLLLPFSLPGPDRLVEAYALTLSVTGVSLASLVAMLVLWAVEAAGRSRKA